MANLSFMSALTDEQRHYAEIIRAKAQELGIPPELAVAVAYQESRLNPRSASSSAGAIGIMQVRPIAALDVGVDPNKLQDPTTNIDAGLRYLKKALNETGDPKVAIIYYNAGPDRLAEIERTQKLPQQTENYLRALKAYGAFNPPAAEQPSTPPAEGAASQPAHGYTILPSFAQPAASAASSAAPGAGQAQSIKADERRIAEAVGLGAGTFESFRRFGARNAPGAGPAGAAAAPGAAVTPSLTGAPPAAGAAPVGSPAAAQSVVRVPGAPVGPADGGYMARGQTGAQVYNTAKSIGLTDIEAARALDTTKQEGGAHDLLTKRREAILDIQRRFPSETYVENPRFGGILTMDKGVGSGPRQSFVAAYPDVDPQAAPPKGPPPLQTLPPRLPVSTTPPKPSGLEQVTQMFARAAQQPLVSGALRYGLPPLAAAGGAGQLMGAKQAFDEGDYLGAALEGIGGAASLASLFPAAAPIGVPVSLAASGINALRKVEPTPFDVESERMTAQEYNRLFGGRLTPEREYRTFGQRARGALR